MRSPSCPRRPARHARRYAAAPAAAVRGRPHDLAACGEAKLNGMDLSGMPTGDFQLRDTEDRERRLADYRGQAVLLFFGFTQCPDVCPTALTRATEIKRLLGADAGKLRVLFITVDPERDTLKS